MGGVKASNATSIFLFHKHHGNDSISSFEDIPVNKSLIDTDGIMGVMRLLFLRHNWYFCY